MRVFCVNPQRKGLFRVRRRRDGFKEVDKGVTCFLGFSALRLLQEPLMRQLRRKHAGASREVVEKPIAGLRANRDRQQQHSRNKQSFHSAHFVSMSPDRYAIKANQSDNASLKAGHFTP